MFMIVMLVILYYIITSIKANNSHIYMELPGVRQAFDLPHCFLPSHIIRCLCNNNATTFLISLIAQINCKQQLLQILFLCIIFFTKHR